MSFRENRAKSVPRSKIVPAVPTNPSTSQNLNPLFAMNPSSGDNRQQIEETTGTNLFIGASGFSQVINSKDIISYKTEYELFYSSLLEQINICDASEISLLKEFLMKIDELIKINIIPSKVLLQFLIIKTSGRLRDLWLKQISIMNDWGLFKNKILDTLFTNIDVALLKTQVINSQQKTNETLRQFVTSVEQQMRFFNINMTETEFIAHIWTRLNEESFKYLQYIIPPKNKEELDAIINHHQSIIALKESRQENIRENTSNSSLNCRYCKQVGHNIDYCKLLQSKQAFANNPKN